MHADPLPGFVIDGAGFLTFVAGVFRSLDGSKLSLVCYTFLMFVEANSTSRPKEKHMAYPGVISNVVRNNFCIELGVREIGR